MDPPLRFRGRDTLHAMTTGFKFQPTIHTIAADFSNDLFITTMFTLTGAHDFHTPATGFRVAAVHAEQIASKQRGFIAAGSGAHFEEGVAFVIRIFWQQKNLKLLFQLLAFLFRFAQFILRHLTHFWIVEHHLCGFDIFLHLLPVGETARNIT